MEERVSAGSHKLIVNNRKSSSLSGVTDVIAFDMNEVLLETELGMLMIKGKDLHVNRLDLDKGEVDIDGQVDALNYSQVPGRKGSIIGKFFTS